MALKARDFLTKLPTYLCISGILRRPTQKFHERVKMRFRGVILQPSDASPQGSFSKCYYQSSASLGRPHLSFCGRSSDVLTWLRATQLGFDTQIRDFLLSQPLESFDFTHSHSEEATSTHGPLIRVSIHNFSISRAAWDIQLRRYVFRQGSDTTHRRRRSGHMPLIQS